jgi:hypothetical protein
MQEWLSSVLGAVGRLEMAVKDGFARITVSANGMEMSARDGNN